MASLALIVSLMFLAALLIGPITYLISLFSWVPKLVIGIFSLICLFIGIYSLLVPVPLFRILGLIDIAIGLRVLLSKRKNETHA